uniref:Uncharacterized protein n=1 Tax=uncultured marine virus TaxID=186617 RepID=A0A0F7L1U1_9VIRU|nr:hypothetical protein [uncultured marine virus]
MALAPKPSAWPSSRTSVPSRSSAAAWRLAALRRTHRRRSMRFRPVVCNQA